MAHAVDQGNSKQPRFSSAYPWDGSVGPRASEETDSYCASAANLPVTDYSYSPSVAHDEATHLAWALSARLRLVKARSSSWRLGTGALSLPACDRRMLHPALATSLPASKLTLTSTTTPKHLLHKSIDPPHVRKPQHMWL